MLTRGAKVLAADKTGLTAVDLKHDRCSELLSLRASGGAALYVTPTHPIRRGAMISYYCTTTALLTSMIKQCSWRSLLLHR